MTVGEVIGELADLIPLHHAARKWGSQRIGRALASPDRMRFYTLTQYLHWLQCRFENQDGTRNKRHSTIVIISARACSRCGRLFVNEKQRMRCGARCE